MKKGEKKIKEETYYCTKRVSKGSEYWYFKEDMSIHNKIDNRLQEDEVRFEYHNYFIDEEHCKKRVEIVKQQINNK